MYPAIVVLVIALLGCGKSEDAKQLAVDVKNKAVDVKDDVRDKAVDVKDTVADKLSSGYATGKRVKDELDKVYKTAHDYDLSVDDIAIATPEGEAHAKRLSEIPTVTVGDATIGYEEDVARSVGGVTRSKHFRATWRRGDKIVRVSYFTSERIDAMAFAELLQRLVPVVERVL